MWIWFLCPQNVPFFRISGMAFGSYANKEAEAAGWWAVACGTWAGGEARAPGSLCPYLAGLVLAAAAGGAEGPRALLLQLLHLGLQVLDVHEVGLLLGLPRAQLQLQGLLLLLQEVQLGLQLCHLLLRSTERTRRPRGESRAGRGKGVCSYHPQPGGRYHWAAGENMTPRRLDGRLHTS